MKTPRKKSTAKAKPTPAAAKPLSAAQQLDALIGKYPAKEQALFRSVRKALRSRFPWADELVYDYSHSLVIGYSPTGKGIESVVALGQREDGLRLYFNQGPKIPDPKGILQGSAKQTRFIPLDSPKTLKLPDVQAFLEAATEYAKPPQSADRRGALIIQTSSAKSAKKKRASR
jgi:hypothetical protein